MSDYTTKTSSLKATTIDTRKIDAKQIDTETLNINGISIDDVNQKYNINLLDNKLIKDLVLKNKLEIRNNHIKVPYDKIYVENEILMELLDYE